MIQPNRYLCLHFTWCQSYQKLTFRKLLFWHGICAAMSLLFFKVSPSNSNSVYSLRLRSVAVVMYCCHILLTMIIHDTHINKKIIQDYKLCIENHKVQHTLLNIILTGINSKLPISANVVKHHKYINIPASLCLSESVSQQYLKKLH